jgi:hypothetical protein
VARYKKKHGNRRGVVAPPEEVRTVVSAPVSSRGPLPPVPTLSGLEEYINAVVARAVSAELRRRFNE